MLRSSPDPLPAAIVRRRTGVRSSCALLLGLALVVASGARAQPAPADPPAAPPAPQQTQSSLFRFVEDVARALEVRADEERASGPFRLDIEGARGIDARKAEREFGARLRRRLRDKGVLLPVSRAPLRARLVLSQENGRVWAVGVLEGGRLPGPSALAVSAPIDRELEVALGATARQGHRSWRLERLGTVPAGVLDVVLLDVDDDISDEIALLSVDGLRLLRYAHGDGRPQLVYGPVPLPGEQAWPRVVVGWMASTSDEKLWIATSAGHSLLFDPTGKRFDEAPHAGVPLRQPELPTHPAPRLLLAPAPRGSPALGTPPTTDKGVALETAELPKTVRELLQWPGRGDSWIWVDDGGRLGARLSQRRAVYLPIAEKAGDRALLVDLNGDGDPELVTSSASGLGESDLLTLYQLDPSLESASVLYRTPLSGGSIAAMAQGDVDYDGTPDLLLVEEQGLDEAVLWRLEYEP